MKKIYFLALIALVFYPLHSQNFKFGKVSKQELEEKVHPLDSTADAAYLYSSRRTYYDFSGSKGFRIINEYHQRIKIYTKSGFDQATKMMKYYKPDVSDKEKIYNVQAVTYNLEGGKVVKVKASRKDVFDQQISKYYAQKKITFPNLKEGSVIELSYKLMSPFYTIIDPLNFQKDIPVNKLEYIVEVPEYFVFKQRAKGFYFISPEASIENRTISWSTRDRNTNVFSLNAQNTSFTNNSASYSVNVQKYVADNIPALKDDEVFVNNISNYRGGVNYELNYIKYPNQPFKYYSTTWSDVAGKVYESIGAELNKSNYYKKDLVSLVDGVSSDPEKVAKIFQFVKSKIKWNGYLGFYPNESLRKVYNEGAGNVGAVNLILISMLRSAGFDANPVLVSTKDNGVPLFPTRNGFNYLVTSVSLGEGYILLDASEPYSVPNLLPSRALNWHGRLILKNGTSQWVDLSTGKPSVKDNFLSVKILDDGSVEGMCRTKFENLGALNFRNQYNAVSEEQLIADLEDEYSIEIENYKLTNKFEIAKPVVRTIKFSSQDLIEDVGGKLYINPLFFNRYSSNPFTQEERKFPVEFSTPWKEKSRVSIQIPEGYTIESVPESKALGLPDDMGLFMYKIISKHNTINLISVLQFNRAEIPASYYETLKGFFGEFVNKQLEKIVLKKEAL